MKSTWSFYNEYGYLGKMTFNSDGTIGTYPSDNEKYWQWNVNGEYLEILNVKKIVSQTYLSQSIRDNGKWMMFGPYILRTDWFKHYLIEN